MRLTEFSAVEESTMARDEAMHEAMHDVCTSLRSNRPCGRCRMCRAVRLDWDTAAQAAAEARAEALADAIEDRAFARELVDARLSWDRGGD